MSDLPKEPDPMEPPDEDEPLDPDPMEPPDENEPPHVAAVNCWCEPVEVERGVFVHRVVN